LCATEFTNALHSTLIKTENPNKPTQEDPRNHKIPCQDQRDYFPPPPADLTHLFRSRPPPQAIVPPHLTEGIKATESENVPAHAGSPNDEGAQKCGQFRKGPTEERGVGKVERIFVYGLEGYMDPRRLEGEGGSGDQKSLPVRVGGGSNGRGAICDVAEV